MKRRIEALLFRRNDGAQRQENATPHTTVLFENSKQRKVPPQERFTKVVGFLAILILLLWWSRSPQPPKTTAVAQEHLRGPATPPTPKRPTAPSNDVFDDVPHDLEAVSSSDHSSDASRPTSLITSKDLTMETVGRLLDDMSASSGARTTGLIAAIDDDDSNDDGATTGATAGQPLIGPGAVCHRPTCRLCEGMLVANEPTQFVPNATRQYVAHHVRLGIVTGSFDDFFRMDLGLCTWMGHVPHSSLHIFSDAVNRSSMRHVGTWHEAQLPKQLTFSKKQTHAKGYTIDWIRAQYRFFQAFHTIATLEVSALPATASAVGGAPPHDGKGEKAINGTNNTSLILFWAVVVDDDTFVNLEAMQLMLTAYDVRELQFLNVPLPPKTLPRAHYQQRLLELIAAHHRAFRPLYLNDNGWGGGGHFMNAAALHRFVNGSERVCVDRYMVKRGYASDVTLRHCLPKLGIHTINDKRLNHCQAAFLKQRLAAPHHVTAHMKRDVVMPRTLAMWRARLYYQVVYHRNITVAPGKSRKAVASPASTSRRYEGQSAYDLLMEVGSCAYGYSCKLKRCDAEHDAAALRLFMANSGNGTFVPLM